MDEVSFLLSTSYDLHPVLTEFLSEKTETVNLQPPYPLIKIAKNIKILQGFKVTNVCTCREYIVVVFFFFFPKIPVEAGKLLHRVLC